VVNVVRAGAKATLSWQSGEAFVAAELLINLRAEGMPTTMAQIVYEEVKQSQACHVIWKQVDAFEPGQPKPMYRDI
jgi:hypothetical protein